jgi:hypothetical protein
MFAFLVVLGIVVDDAIVVGENVYEHRQKKASPLNASSLPPHPYGDILGVRYYLLHRYHSCDRSMSILDFG